MTKNLGGEEEGTKEFFTLFCDETIREKEDGWTFLFLFSLLFGGSNLVEKKL